MKMFVSLSVLFFSLSSFGYNGTKLCYQAGQNNLRGFYTDASFWDGKFVSAKTASYYAGKNMADEDVVIYEYDVQTTGGAQYVRVVMLQKGCQALVIHSAANKQAMEDDDLDAAQGGVSEE